MALPVFLIVATLAGALLVGAQLPDGTGKRLVAERCAVCHEPDIVASQRKDRDGWVVVLATMIDRGAELDDRERDTVLDYLAKNFGPPPATPASPATDPSVERTALRFIDGICSSCHAADIIAATQATKDGWLEIIQKMNSKGAGMSEADVDLLADYLARTYPAPKGQ